MSYSNTTNGCLKPLIILGIILFCIIYPFYDGYVDRELDSSDLRKYVLDSSKTPAWIDGYNLIHFAPAINDWVVSSTTFHFTVHYKNKASEEFSVVTKFPEPASLEQPLVIEISNKNLAYIRDPDIKVWHWNLYSAKGHRKPMKLAKLIHDGVFEGAHIFVKLIEGFFGLFDRSN